MASELSHVGVQQYQQKRLLMQELRARLLAETPADTVQARDLLLEIEGDITRCDYLLRERQALQRCGAELRRQIAELQAVAA